MVHVKLFGETQVLSDVEALSGKGLHFLINGWVLSCQAGWGNYCSQNPARGGKKLTPQTIRTDCEIAVWKDGNSDMIEFDGDSVMGYVLWDMVLDIVEYLRKITPNYKEETVKRRILALRDKYKVK